MKVTEKKLADGRIQLDAVASTAEVSHAFAMAQYAFAQQMGVQVGPGQTVAQAAEQQMGIKDLDAIVRDQAAEFLTPFAIDKRNITPAYPASSTYAKPIEKGKAFEFQLVVAPKPEYELTSYEPVSISVPPLEVAEAEIDEQIALLADNYATFETDDPRPVGKHDSMLLALEAKRAGEEMAGLSTEGRTFVMGMGLMPDEFEDQLLGMNVGETKSFSFGLPGAPDDTPIDVTVTVKEMQKKVIPTINDEWVAANMPIYRDAAAMRAALSDMMMTERTAQYENMKMQMAASELGRRFKGSIADEVYEAMRDSLMANIRAQVSQQGMTMEQFMQMQGGEQQFGMMLMMQTREMLVQGYALDAVFRHEKLMLSDDDLLAAARTVSPQDPKGAQRQMEEEGRGFALREMAERLKANRWLVEHAEVKIMDVVAPGTEAEAVQAAEEAVAQAVAANAVADAEASEPAAE